MKRGILVWCFWVLACFQSVPSFACRYNVRDVGFVELETQPYRLYCFVRQDTPGDVVSAFQEAATPAFQDANISLEVVDVDRQKDAEPLKHLGAFGPRPEWPAALLVSPDGQTMPVSLPQSAKSYRESLQSTLRGITSSPKREELVRAARESFAAILLIEGQDAQGNSRARAAIESAIVEIRSQMGLLPKAISQAPAMVVLEAAAHAQEKVLLWSLGLDAGQASQPRVAVVYGKARWIGPLMKGDEISERNLTGILSMIGADCECGLDISWTQGTRLPVRWPEAQNASLAKALGFDPENPMVKVEVSRILGRRGTSRTASLGYQELSLDGDPPARANVAETPPASTSVASKPGGIRLSHVESSTRTRGGPIFRNSVVALAVLAGLVGAASALVLFRKRG